jgi:hypothetical protein
VAKGSAKDKASYGSKDRGKAEVTSGNPAAMARAHAQQLPAKASRAGNESRIGNDTLTEGAKPESDDGDKPMKHLENINQPKGEHDSDGYLLGPGELFDSPKAPPPAKQLLTVAIKARNQSNVAERMVKGDATNKGQHLSSLHFFHCEVRKAYANTATGIKRASI